MQKLEDFIANIVKTKSMVLYGTEYVITNCVYASDGELTKIVLCLVSAGGQTIKVDVESHENR